MSSTGLTADLSKVGLLTVDRENMSNDDILKLLPKSTNSSSKAKALRRCTFSADCTKIASAGELCNDHLCSLYREGKIDISSTTGVISATNNNSADQVRSRDSPVTASQSRESAPVALHSGSRHRQSLPVTLDPGSRQDAQKRNRKSGEHAARLSPIEGNAVDQQPSPSEQLKKKPRFETDTEHEQITVAIGNIPEATVAADGIAPIVPSINTLHQDLTPNRSVVTDDRPSGTVDVEDCKAVSNTRNLNEIKDEVTKEKMRQACQSSDTSQQSDNSQLAEQPDPALNEWHESSEDRSNEDRETAESDEPTASAGSEEQQLLAYQFDPPNTRVNVKAVQESAGITVNIAKTIGDVVKSEWQTDYPHFKNQMKRK